MTVPAQAGISVIVPAFNAGRFLAEALDSIAAQTVAPSEVLVIDDGSHDGCPGVAQDRGITIRLIHQPHRGAAAARNRGVRLATQPMLAFLDADDVWHPRKLACQLAALANSPGQAMVFGHCVEFSDPVDCFPIRPSTLEALSFSALLIARSTFLRIGLLREDMAIGELAEWLDRAQQLGVSRKIVAEAVFRRRVHANNTTRLHQDTRGAYLRFLRERRQGRRRHD